MGRDKPEGVVDRRADVSVGAGEQAETPTERRVRVLRGGPSLLEPSDKRASRRAAGRAGRRRSPVCNIPFMWAAGAGLQLMIATRRGGPTPDWTPHGEHTPRKLRLRRGLRPRIRRAALHLQRARFQERCEQAALSSASSAAARRGRARGPRQPRRERRDPDPASALGEHVNDCWPELVGPADRSLVHWLRRLVFRGAWLDQRVNEGELDICFVEESATFAYVQPERDGEPIELAPEPSLGPGRLPALTPARPGRALLLRRPRGPWPVPGRSPRHRPPRRAARGAACRC